jgi:large-conductance mechanosensitive channel
MVKLAIANNVVKNVSKIGTDLSLMLQGPRKFMSFGRFMSTYTVVGTIIGYILGILITNVFTSYIDDLFIPVIINSWMPETKENVHIFGKAVNIKASVRHTIIFIISLLLIYLSIGFVHFNNLKDYT